MAPTGGSNTGREANSSLDGSGVIVVVEVRVGTSQLCKKNSSGRVGLENCERREKGLGGE